MKDVIVFAVSCNKYKERIESCEKTWAEPLRRRGIKVYYVVGNPEQNKEFILEDNILSVKCKDDYLGLPAKTRMLTKYFTKHCKQTKYLFKCDDDTYIHVNKFANYNIDNAEYLGCPVQSFYASGGAGYFLNHRTAKIIADSDLDRGAEDLLVGEELQKHDVKFVHDRKFNGWPGGWGKSENWRDNGSNNGMGDLVPPYKDLKGFITNHLLRLPAEKMYEIHEVVTKGEMDENRKRTPIKKYLKEKAPKFKKYIKGKRVAIVGPSDHLIDSDYGEIINSYDIVIRTNRAMDIDKKYSKDIGNRTDILATCFYPPAIGNYTPEKIKDNGIKWLYCPLPLKRPFGKDIRQHYMKLGEEFLIHVGDENRWDKLEKSIDTRPNTGLAAIVELLAYKPKELHVCGFSFYSTNFIPSYTTPQWQKVILDSIEVTHKQAPQKEYIFKLIKHNLITVDPFLQEMYDNEKE
jgi:hypothetical protein